jgi:EAL domain-containing protein (putative c-di-GMP-specific phosphodiesterase class I)
LWLETGYRLSVAVNVSYIQFVRNNLLEQIKDILDETRLPPELLELELTESIMATDPESVLTVVDQLRATGVTLAIDDFGTGYSSLSYLKRFAVHKLKIDQSFVRDILNDKDDAMIVATIINLAKSLNILSIAEGVEYIEQANALREMGCTQVQGFWLAKPLTVAKMDDLLELSTSWS